MESNLNKEEEYRKQLAWALNNYLRQIQQFLEISEEDFLIIGGKLREYQNLSIKINNIAKSIIHAIGTDILSRSIDKLGYLLITIGDHLTTASESTGKDRRDLKNIHANLANIEGGLDGFDKIVKTLRMLSISSKVESARLNLMDGGFYLLAETVDKMSTEISENKQVIKNKSKILLQQIALSLADLSFMSAEQEKQNETFKKTTIQSLELLKQKNIVCANAIEEINETGIKLSVYLLDIVESIQFHDITRQQLQHVDEVLVDLGQVLSNESDGSIELFSHIHDNTELQARQLGGTLKDFTKSVMSIIDNLIEVETGTHKLFEQSRKIIGTDTTQNNLDQDLFEQDLLYLTNGLQKSLRIERNLDTSFAEIVNIVTDLVQQIDTIEEIGDEIELIALNARVKAAHLGIDGATLGVLAEAIQKLSIEAKVQTTRTYDLLKIIDILAGEMRSELTSTSHQEINTLMETTIEDLYSLVASIKDVENTALAETKELDGIVNIFKNELQTTIGKIRIHTSAEQMLIPVITGLESITNELRSRYNIESHRAKNTRNIENKYTMQSEREIHIQYIKTTGLTKELDSQNYPDTEGLEDNIELF